MYYEDVNYGLRVKNRIEENGDLFITIDNITVSTMIEHLERKMSPLRPVYEILLPTKWKKISLDGELNPDNNIDTDGDTLTDWEEVNVDELIELSDGNYTLPKVTLKSLFETLKRYDNDEYLFITGKTLPIYYLPILSDPTEADSDGDGISDYDETIGVSYTTPDGKVNDYKGSPLKKGLADGITGRLTLISCHDGEQEWTEGHAFFVYTSYINDVLDFSTFSYGWSRINTAESWSAENLQEDIPTQSEYAINIGESVSIGLGASREDASKQNGFNYNMEVYKHLDKKYGFSYDTNAYIYQDIKEEELYKLISYCSDESRNHWGYIHNCAELASKAWNLISTTHVNAHYISVITPGVTLLFSTPKGLYKNLETINGSAKNYPFDSQF